MVELLGIISSLLTILVYVVYLDQTRKGASTPNPATWLIWLTAGAINVFTYLQLPEIKGDLFKAAAIITSNSCVGLFFIYSLIKGKFAKLTRIETIALIGAVIVGAFWKTSQDPQKANLLLQIIYLISFYPTIAGLLHKKMREGWLAWAIGASAYVFSTASIAIDFKGDWTALAYPIAIGICGNGSVAIIAFFTKQTSAQKGIKE